MSEELLGKVQRLKYKTVFLDMATYVDTDGKLRHLMLTGPVPPKEKDSFRVVCSVVNGLLEKGVRNKQSILGVLNRTRGVELDVLGFVSGLVRSTQLPLE